MFPAPPATPSEATPSEPVVSAPIPTSQPEAAPLPPLAPTLGRPLKFSDLEVGAVISGEDLEAAVARALERAGTFHLERTTKMKTLSADFRLDVQCRPTVAWRSSSGTLTEPLELEVHLDGRTASSVDGKEWIREPRALHPEKDLCVPPLASWSRWLVVERKVAGDSMVAALRPDATAAERARGGTQWELDEHLRPVVHSYRHG